MESSRQEYWSGLPFPSPGDLPDPRIKLESPTLLAGEFFTAEPPGKPSVNHAAAAAKSLQSCLTLCDPIDGSPSGSPVPGILKARTLEWGAIAFSAQGTYLSTNMAFMVLSTSDSVQFSSVTQSCLTLCNPMNCCTPGFPVLHHLSEFAQTHVHWEKAMALHSSTVAWKIPWTEEPGRLRSMGSLGVGHD